MSDDDVWYLVLVVDVAIVGMLLLVLWGERYLAREFLRRNNNSKGGRGGGDV